MRLYINQFRGEKITFSAPLGRDPALGARNTTKKKKKEL